jgi:hypothetical protein
MLPASKTKISTTLTLTIWWSLQVTPKKTFT